MRILLIASCLFLLAACGNNDQQTARDKSSEASTNTVEKQQEQLTKDGLIAQNVLNGKMSMSLPETFGVMPKEILEAKYPASNRPTEVYSNENGTVSIAVNHTNNAITLEQLPQLLPVFEQQFSNLYPTIKWQKKEVIKINGRDFVILEFETPAIDTPIYNLMAVSSLDGRMLMGSFNCPIGMKSEWKEKANQIINSIEVL